LPRAPRNVKADAAEGRCGLDRQRLPLAQSL